MSVDVDAPVALSKVLADPVRWRILELLSVEELCVCHLVDELDVNQPLVSHHLRVLRDAGLVDTERYRYWTYYRLRAGALAPLLSALDRLASIPTAGSDRRRPCC